MIRGAKLRWKFAYQLGILALPVLVAQGKPAVRPTVAELAAITKRGLLLAEYDSVAAEASDAVSASHTTSTMNGRYIARKTAAGWVVDFGRLSQDDAFLVYYEAVQIGTSPKFEVKSFDPPREDKAWNRAAAKGIETAMKDFGGTSRPYNIAVLPAQRGSMYVYLYPAQVNAGVYSLGADVRYHVSSDGLKIIGKRQMHRSIIESVPRRSDMKVEGGYHTHVLSELPEDTDVLLVMNRQPRIPEIVIAGPYMFTIYVNGQITVEDRPKPKGHT